jgi:hypothetical protein
MFARGRVWLAPVTTVVVFVLAVFALAAPCSGQDLPAASIADSAREVKGAAFLTRIRLADPDYRVVLMACLKGGELNLLLSRQLEPDQIPLFVKGLLGQLSKEFPGENWSVVAFRPIVPLAEAAVARLDAQTGQVEFRSALGQARTP